MTKEIILPDAESLSLILLQAKLESHALQLGAARYQDNLEYLQDHDQGGDHTSYTKLTERYLHDTAMCILEGDIPRPRLLPIDAILEILSADQLAYITLSELWSSTSHTNQSPIKRISEKIGKWIETECWHSKALDADLAKFTKIFGKARKRHSSRSARRKVVSKYVKSIGLQELGWEPRQLASAGAYVINCAVKTTGLFALIECDRGVLKVIRSEKGNEQAMEIQKAEMWSRPKHLPMVIPPRPHTTRDQGGYLTPEVSRHTKLVRTRSKVAEGRLGVSRTRGQMGRYLGAINTVQGSSYKVNPFMLKVVQQCTDQNVRVGKLPHMQQVDLPDLPKGYDAMPDQERFFWMNKRKAARTYNQGLSSTYSHHQSDLKTAHDFNHYERFYLPITADFRGRIYPLPGFNGQRGDHIKSLIQFSEGHVLNDLDARQLAIHLANAGDFDKVSKCTLSDRAQWTIDHIDDLDAAVRDPLATDWWRDADEPFQFLAAAEDFCRWLRDPTTHLSRTSCQLDGSCSGIQHYSMIGRSSADGRLVNLTDTAKMQDLYQAVADRVMVVLNEEKDDPMAQLWLAYGVTRSTVKRNVMTYAYSSETYGFSNQLMEDLMGPLQAEVIEGKRVVHPFGEDGGFAAATFLAKIIFASVSGTVSAASNSMTWMKTVARILAHEGKHLEMITPLGFPVVHRYVEHSRQRATLFLYDKDLPPARAKPHDKVIGDDVYRQHSPLYNYESTGRISKTKAVSAVAPNIIHAMDSTHMLMTVLAAKEEGIKDFNLIHDSFGTHADNILRLGEITREQLVKLYTDFDPLVEIQNYAASVLSPEGLAKIPPLPPKGDLDFQQVLRAQYAFC